MESESQPKYAVNQKIAKSLLVLAGLVFVSFAFFRSNADKNSTTINQGVGAQQSEENLKVAREDGTSNQEDSVQQSEANPKSSMEDGAKGTIIRADNSEFGSMLFDDRGQAIYIWELENSNTAKCYGSCAKAWPPVLTDGAPIASTDVNSALLGTTQRTDGATQVTYNGHPLYYYANEKAGEVKCHNVRTHGGLWWVIQPSGNRAS